MSDIGPIWFNPGPDFINIVPVRILSISSPAPDFIKQIQVCAYSLIETGLRFGEKGFNITMVHLCPTTPYFCLPFPSDVFNFGIYIA